MSEITRILDRVQQGDALAANELLPLVYEELRLVAANKMASEPEGQTLQPTALVHEAWLRVAGADQEIHFENRAHFFSAAAEAMRRILIERARRRRSARHGGALVRVEFDGLEIAAPAPDDELIALDDALDRFAEVDPQKAQLVKLRFFTGMTIEEAATALAISDSTAKCWWTYARAWLFAEIKDSNER